MTRPHTLKKHGTREEVKEIRDVLVRSRYTFKSPDSDPLRKGLSIRQIV